MYIPYLVLLLVDLLHAVLAIPQPRIKGSDVTAHEVTRRDRVLISASQLDDNAGSRSILARANFTSTPVNDTYKFQRGPDGKFYYTGTPYPQVGFRVLAQGVKTHSVAFNDSAGLCGPSGGDPWKLTPENWNAAQTSENIQHFIQGQKDTQGLQWLPNESPPLPFAAWLGRQMTNLASYNCSLENPCITDVNCDSVGQGRRDGSAQFIRSRWGYFALIAFRNLNLQLSNTYASLDGAQIDNTLSTFSVDNFFPKKDQQFGLRNFLIGMGTFLGVAAGVLPVIGGATLGTAAAIVPAIGGLLGNSIAANTDPDASSKIYSDYVKKTYAAIRMGLDFGAATIFSGASIADSGVNITTMFEGGYWLNSSQLTPLTTLTNATAMEMFARSINALWKTPTSNKIYITYLDLQDPTNAACAADTSGPPDSKYCSERGVYYLYNWLEVDVQFGEGVPNYPWGAQSLPNLGIALPRVVESSVRSGFLAQELTGNKYAYDQLTGTKRILDDAIAAPGQLPGILIGAGHLPGTWTIPVCNMGTYGARWNSDYTITTNKNYVKRAIPCMCGPGGTETAAWVAAAGLKDYGDYYSYCSFDIGNTAAGFVWPDGVTQVDLGFGDPIKKPS